MVDITKKVNIKNLNKIKNPDERRKALEEAGDFILDQILKRVSQGQSPVKGVKAFDALSPAYKKIKKEISGSTRPNMELFGDMLDALEMRIEGSKLEVGIFQDSGQADKADGHNNFSGDSKLPKRRFIPQKNQTFKKNITQGIDRIISEYIDGES